MAEWRFRTMAGLTRRSILHSGAAVALFGAASSVSRLDAQTVGTLTDVSLSGDHVEVGARQGAFIGTWQPVGGSISSVAFVDGGDAGGRFQLFGTSQLQAGAASPDFSDSNANARGLPNYEISVLFNGNLQKNFLIRPYFTKVEPSGGEGGSTIEVTTLVAFRSALQSASTNPRIVRVPTNFTGIFETNRKANVATIPQGTKNLTVRGHRQVYIAKDGGITFTGTRSDFSEETENILFYNCLFAVGHELPGMPYEDRDNVTLRHGKNIMFKNCTFLAGIDEAASVIANAKRYPIPRHIRFHRCYFGMPMVPDTGTTLHPEGGHPVGLLLGELGELDLVVDKCVFTSFSERSPLLVMRCIGSLAQNNIVAWWGGAGTRGATFTRRSQGYPFGSAMIRGCLFWNKISSIGNDRERAYVRTHHICFAPKRPIVPPDQCYLPEGTDHDNWMLASFGRPTELSEPITRSMVGNVGESNSDPSVLVTTEPFATEMDDELMPTSTLDQQQALWDDVWQKVGCRELDGNGNIVSGVEYAGQLQYDDQVRQLATNGQIHRPTQSTMTWPLSVPG